MLLYSNDASFRISLQLTGSVVYQRSTIGIGILMMLGNIACQCFINYGPDYLVPDIPNNYGVATLGMVVAFASVFRTNLAWQRYWESLSQVRYMYSKCEDAFSAFAVFSRMAAEKYRQRGDEESMAKANRVQAEYTRMTNYFSWMSALAVDRISHGCTSRMDRRHEVAKWKDQIITLRELHHTDVTGATNLPEMRVGRAKDQWTNSDWENSFIVCALPSKEEHDLLSASEDRVQAVMTWILGSLAHTCADLDTPPPIQSRVYQELSNAMVGFQNCVKVADVPFPFPYAQLLTLMIFLFALITPAAVAVFTRSFIAGPAFTMVVGLSIWCVNEVAKDLENPFGQSANDICLEDMHSSFVGMLEETPVVLDVQSAVRLKEFAEKKDPNCDLKARDCDGQRVQAAEQLAHAAVPATSTAAALPQRLSEGSGWRKAADAAQLPIEGFAAAVPSVAAPAATVEATGQTKMPTSTQNSLSSQCVTEATGPLELVPAKVKQRNDGPQEFSRGTAHALASSDGHLQVVHVIDTQLAQISIRMESLLAQIARELEVARAVEQNVDDFTV